MSIPQLYIPTDSEIVAVITPEMKFSDTDDAPGADPAYFAKYSRAEAILLAGAIAYTDADGWTVASQGKPGTRYHVNRERCECYDQQQHGGECKHQMAVRLYIAIIVARLRADLTAPFGVDVWGEDVVTREATPQLICHAVQTARGWRPTTGAEVAAYARYLAGAMGADQVSLESILRRATGDNLTLSFDVYYGSGAMTFTGYHIAPAPWVKFEHADRQAMAPAAADALMRRYGWELVQRPVKGTGFTHRYILRRVAENPADHAPGYSVNNYTDAAVERRRQEVVFAGFEGRKPNLRPRKVA